MAEDEGSSSASVVLKYAIHKYSSFTANYAPE